MTENTHSKITAVRNDLGVGVLGVLTESAHGCITSSGKLTPPSEDILPPQALLSLQLTFCSKIVENATYSQRHTKFRKTCVTAS